MNNRVPLPGYGASRTAQTDAGLRAHMLGVFRNMGLGLVITGLVAAFIGNTPVLAAAIFGTPLKWVAIFAPLAFVFFFTFRIEKMTTSGARMAFWAFSAVMGVSLASIFLMFTGGSIAQAFFSAAVMFLAMSLWGYTTQRDLTKMGSFLIMGLIGIIVASLINIFIGSSAMAMVISILGVVIFTGLTAWDTQRIKSDYFAYAGHEIAAKMQVMGALSLYLNFVNLFQMLLSLTGERE
ncbi:FIG005935: membrane protein [Sphingobium indicum BiD32]|uniref:FIG005935: membrane protein n=1 Tax=Sphingobium indicum BiD32 TaxID=1301087 RepID=N1MM24_9SPHN|nr:Bax inhibitor-1/YccA family protein [Sphingobium indicum]CCW16652.1 FIG005935: membrane protein [Sphingobium indicum BiD32]